MSTREADREETSVSYDSFARNARSLRSLVTNDCRNPFKPFFLRPSSHLSDFRNLQQQQQEQQEKQQRCHSSRQKSADVTQGELRHLNEDKSTGADDDVNKPLDDSNCVKVRRELARLVRAAVASLSDVSSPHGEMLRYLLTQLPDLFGHDTNNQSLGQLLSLGDKRRDRHQRYRGRETSSSLGSVSNISSTSAAYGSTSSSSSDHEEDENSENGEKTEAPYDEDAAALRELEERYPKAGKRTTKRKENKKEMKKRSSMDVSTKPLSAAEKALYIILKTSPVLAGGKRVATQNTSSLFNLQPRCPTSNAAIRILETFYLNRSKASSWIRSHQQGISAFDSRTEIEKATSNAQHNPASKLQIDKTEPNTAASKQRRLHTSSYPQLLSDNRRWSLELDPIVTSSVQPASVSTTRKGHAAQKIQTREDAFQSLLNEQNNMHYRSDALLHSELFSNAADGDEGHQSSPFSSAVAGEGGAAVMNKNNYNVTTYDDNDNSCVSVGRAAYRSADSGNIHLAFGQDPAVIIGETASNSHNIRSLYSSFASAAPSSLKFVNTALLDIYGRRGGGSGRCDRCGGNKIHEKECFVISGNNDNSYAIGGSTSSFPPLPHTQCGTWGASDVLSVPSFAMGGYTVFDAVKNKKLPRKRRGGSNRGIDNSNSGDQFGGGASTKRSRGEENSSSSDDDDDDGDDENREETKRSNAEKNNFNDSDFDFSLSGRDKNQQKKNNVTTNSAAKSDTRKSPAFSLPQTPFSFFEHRFQEGVRGEKTNSIAAATNNNNNYKNGNSFTIGTESISREALTILHLSLHYVAVGLPDPFSVVVRRPIPYRSHGWLCLSDDLLTISNCPQLRARGVKVPVKNMIVPLADLCHVGNLCLRLKAVVEAGNSIGLLTGGGSSLCVPPSTSSKSRGKTVESDSGGIAPLSAVAVGSIGIAAMAALRYCLRLYTEAVGNGGFGGRQQEGNENRVRNDGRRKDRQSGQKRPSSDNTSAYEDDFGEDEENNPFSVATNGLTSHKNLHNVTPELYLDTAQAISEAAEVFSILADIYAISLQKEWKPLHSIQHCTSATFLSNLHAYAVGTYHQSLNASRVATIVLRFVMLPLTKSMASWAFNGILSDPNAEFFIESQSSLLVANSSKNSPLSSPSRRSGRQSEVVEEVAHEETVERFSVNLDPLKLPKTVIEEDTAFDILCAGLARRMLENCICVMLSPYAEETVRGELAKHAQDGSMAAFSSSYKTETINGKKSVTKGDFETPPEFNRGDLCKGRGGLGGALTGITQWVRDRMDEINDEFENEENEEEYGYDENDNINNVDSRSLSDAASGKGKPSPSSVKSTRSLRSTASSSNTRKTFLSLATKSATSKNIPKKPLPSKNHEAAKSLSSSVSYSLSAAAANATNSGNPGTHYHVAHHNKPTTFNYKPLDSGPLPSPSSIPPASKYSSKSQKLSTSNQTNCISSSSVFASSDEDDVLFDAILLDYLSALRGEHAEIGPHPALEEHSSKWRTFFIKCESLLYGEEIVVPEVEDEALNVLVSHHLLLSGAKEDREESGSNSQQQQPLRQQQRAISYIDEAGQMRIRYEYAHGMNKNNNAEEREGFDAEIDALSEIVHAAERQGDYGGFSNFNGKNHPLQKDLEEAEAEERERRRRLKNDRVKRRRVRFEGDDDDGNESAKTHENEAAVTQQALLDAKKAELKEIAKLQMLLEHERKMKIIHWQSCRSDWLARRARFSTKRAVAVASVVNECSKTMKKHGIEVISAETTAEPTTAKGKNESSLLSQGYDNEISENFDSDAPIVLDLEEGGEEEEDTPSSPLQTVESGGKDESATRTQRTKRGRLTFPYVAGRFVVALSSNLTPSTTAATANQNMDALFTTASDSLAPRYPKSIVPKSAFALDERTAINLGIDTLARGGRRSLESGATSFSSPSSTLRLLTGGGEEAMVDNPYPEFNLLRTEHSNGIVTFTTTAQRDETLLTPSATPTATTTLEADVKNKGNVAGLVQPTRTISSSAAVSTTAATRGHPRSAAGEGSGDLGNKIPLSKQALAALQEVGDVGRSSHPHASQPLASDEKEAARQSANNGGGGVSPYDPLKSVKENQKIEEESRKSSGGGKFWDQKLVVGDEEGRKRDLIEKIVTGTAEEDTNMKPMMPTSSSLSGVSGGLYNGSANVTAHQHGEDAPNDAEYEAQHKVYSINDPEFAELVGYRRFHHRDEALQKIREDFERREVALAMSALPKIVIRGSTASSTAEPFSWGRELDTADKENLWTIRRQPKATAMSATGKLPTNRKDQPVPPITSSIRSIDGYESAYSFVEEQLKLDHLNNSCTHRRRQDAQNTTRSMASSDLKRIRSEDQKNVSASVDYGAKRVHHKDRAERNNGEEESRGLQKDNESKRFLNEIIDKWKYGTRPSSSIRTKVSPLLPYPITRRDVYGNSLCSTESLAKLPLEKLPSVLIQSHIASFGKFVCNYYSQKALQFLLMPGKGPIRQLLQGLHDVLLLQNDLLADELLTAWSPYSSENRSFSGGVAGMQVPSTFDVNATFSLFCTTFRKTWARTDASRWAPLELSIADDINGENENNDDNDNDGSTTFNTLTFVRRLPPAKNSFELLPHIMVDPPTAEKLNNIQRYNDFIDGYSPHFSSSMVSSSFFAMPSSGGGRSFLKSNSGRHREFLSVLPSQAVERYGDVFVSLVFWRWVRELFSSLWYLTTKRSQLREVWSFSVVARGVLFILSDFIYYNVKSESSRLLKQLFADEGKSYAQKASLDALTDDLDHFLERVFVATLLAAPFARARRQARALVRIVEDVHETLLNEKLLAAMIRKGSENNNKNEDREESQMTHIPSFSDYVRLKTREFSVATDALIRHLEGASSMGSDKTITQINSIVNALRAAIRQQ